jgi:hypothetical protein
VLQALYFCKPFRLLTQRYAPAVPAAEETLLACLADLYNKIGAQKKRSGTVAPRRFITKLRKDNGTRCRRPFQSRPWLTGAAGPGLRQSCFAGTCIRTPTSFSTIC